MIYNTVKLTEEAIAQLEAVQKNGIDVMCSSGRLFISLTWTLGRSWWLEILRQLSGFSTR